MATEEPKEPDSLFVQAREFENLGRYKEAADLYLQAALGFVKAGQIGEAIMGLMSAARTYEKEQDWRKVGDLWNSIGEHIQSHSEQEVVDSDTIDALFRHKVIGLTTWEKQQDLNHRAAWAFQWAAQHFEKEEGPALVSNLFSKAGYSAEKATNFPDRHRWAGMLFEKASVYSIRATATQELGPGFDTLVHKMEENYNWIGSGDKRNTNEKYFYLTRGYRNIRLAFQAIGDTLEAEKIRRKELKARQSHERSSGRYLQACLTWLVWHVWVVPAIWAASVFVVFPLIYWFANVLTVDKQNVLSWHHYISFSALVATTSGYGIVTPLRMGLIIATIELIFSYGLLALLVALLVQYFLRWRGGD